jgi:Leucine-rich repeat (LRR) protein
MKVKTIVSAIILILVPLASLIYGVIPDQEREALVALYNSTNGANWNINISWLEAKGTEGTWYGVTVENIGGTDHITQISLDNNNLNGIIPSEVGNLSNLKYLYLSTNVLTGSIPGELGNLSNLREITLGENNLTGNIPKWFGNLNNLAKINLCSNDFSGDIPPELGNLTNLEYLYLDNNGLTDSIPDELGNLSNLKKITLDVNNLTGSIPKWFGNLINLEQISLGFNDFSGNIPPELGNLSKLQYLYLDNNQLTGTIPNELGNLSNLKKITLDVNNLTGSIPKWFGNLINLEQISLGFNDFSGNIPPELGNLSNLEYLYLDNNNLTGTIPDELGNLSNLKKITLDVNNLTGNIPKWIGNLINLKQISLGFNDFFGNIPLELGNLSKLQYLHLDNNELTGTIPYKLGNLSNLKEITVDVNNLSGSIPSELGNLSNLQKLYLNNNQLSGTIPTSLTNLTKLSYPNVDIGYNCLSANDAALRNWLDNVDPDWEVNQNACKSPEISVNRTRLNFGYIIGSSNLPVETLTISNSGGGTLNWTVSTDIQLVTLSPASGTNSGVVEVTIDTGNLNPGEFKGVIYVTDSAATNSPVEIVINLTVKSRSQASPPFGEFSTPIYGSTVCSSVPVTGWVLGDTGMESVKIYRGEISNLVYIGDAVFVERARPDVEAAYPGYPMNYKAGWGYMMLTNFLPNGGNGTFHIRAIATDKEGLKTTLGIKTITCDNANAVKPFGAIDTPGQGGTASGGSYINWGWALTPVPNSIPTSGTTINVWVDGINLGNPTYNIYRADIAALFPGYANSSGSAGYFYLDTTAYSNGVHTIQWTVTDNAGNTDGIGSRYFTIENSGTGRQQSLVTSHWSLGNEKLNSIPINHFEPVKIRKGYQPGAKLKKNYPGDNGIINVTIKELERLEIRFSQDSSLINGYMIVGNRSGTLPIGSFLDIKGGAFYWQPGVGFVGDYHFVFVEKELTGEIKKTNVFVKILPKFDDK